MLAVLVSVRSRREGATVRSLGDVLGHGCLCVLRLVEDREPHGGNSIASSLHDCGITARGAGVLPMVRLVRRQGWGLERRRCQWSVEPMHDAGNLAGASRICMLQDARSVDPGARATAMRRRGPHGLGLMARYDGGSSMRRDPCPLEPDTPLGTHLLLPFPLSPLGVSYQDQGGHWAHPPASVPII